MKLITIVVLSVIGLAHAGTDSIDETIMDKIDVINLLTNCYGQRNMDEYLQALHTACEECGLKSDVKASVLSRVTGVSPVQSVHQAHTVTHPVRVAANPWMYSSPYVLYGRKRRAISDAEVANFLQMFNEFKQINADKMAGLKCVLTKLDVLDAYGNINLQTMLNDINTSGLEPELKQKFVDGFNDCYDVSNSWPQKMLDRHEGTKEHGRHYIFFACTKKMEQRICYMKQAKDMMDRFYGKMDDVDHAAYGFPADKYEAFYLSARAKYETMSPALKAVDEFLFGRAKFL